MSNTRDPKKENEAKLFKGASPHKEEKGVITISLVRGGELEIEGDRDRLKEIKLKLDNKSMKADVQVENLLRRIMKDYKLHVEESIDRGSISISGDGAGPMMKNMNNNVLDFLLEKKLITLDEKTNVRDKRTHIPFSSKSIPK